MSPTHTLPTPGVCHPHPAARVLQFTLLAVAVGGLSATVWLNVAQTEWDRRNVTHTDPADAFVNGSIGTELAPLVAFEVLPELFPDEFHPVDRYLEASRVKGQPSAGDWIDQYGFIRRNLAGPPVEPSLPLPVGFTLSYHRPDSGAPSPVLFVGLSCAACHSAEIRTEADKPGPVIYGVGNAALNLLAFSEAVRAVVLKQVDPKDPQSDYVLTLDAIRQAQARKGHEMTAAETALTWGWLRAIRGDARNSIAEYQRVIDEPYRAAELVDPRYALAGPIRTQPFRSLVRVHLDRPGWWAGAHQMDQGFSKIPVVFHQAHRFHGNWAQFDGSVKSIPARSTLAASTAGANVNNLSRHDLSEHIKRAAEYTETLAPPTWEKLFGKPAARDGAVFDRGKAVYRSECYACHGGPTADGGWTWDEKLKVEVKLASGELKQFGFGDVIPLEVIGTDPQRVQFRHKDVIAQVVADKFGKDFRKDHPLAFKEDDLRAPDGYYAGPIGGAFLRAPYLHNASILTLSELIGREDRRDRFYRGRNEYDPDRVGWKSPTVDLPRNPDGTTNPRPLDRHLYFLFDTKVRGNSAAGHAYPRWAFDPADSMKRKAGLAPPQEQDLDALLEYLRTL
jgi:hypothetical protein